MDFQNLFNDVKNIEEQVPVVPAGIYEAIIQDVYVDTVETKNGDRNILRIILVLQGNAGALMTDNSSPVDGTTMEYGIFLPDESDKAMPSKFGRGETMYEVSVRKLKKFFKKAGIDPTQFPSFEDAINALKGAQVKVEIENKMTDDGIYFDNIKRIV